LCAYGKAEGRHFELKLSQQLDHCLQNTVTWINE